ncbi:MAG: DUF4192 family protein [Streptosporangiaceae bacterium]
MTALESLDYQIARDRMKGNPVITKMAAGVATVPLADLAHQDGTPRFEFMQRANRSFDTAESQNADNPCYEPYPADAHRHLGLIAEAVLAERAAIREAVASAMAAPGTCPESGAVAGIIERLRAGEFTRGDSPRYRSPPVICQAAHSFRPGLSTRMRSSLMTIRKPNRVTTPKRAGNCPPATSSRPEISRWPAPPPGSAKPAATSARSAYPSRAPTPILPREPVTRPARAAAPPRDPAAIALPDPKRPERRYPAMTDIQRSQSPSTPAGGSRPAPARSPEPAPALGVRIGSPASLLAIVPHLLGFEPASSMVIVAMKPRGQVLLTLRYDLPDPPDPQITAGIAGHAIDVLTAQRVETAVAVGYGSGPLVTPVAGALRTCAPQAGIEVAEILRAEDSRYWSYLCTDPACCPPEGTPFEAAGHPASAAMPAAGGKVLGARSELADTVAALGGQAGESMRRATRRAEEQAARLAARSAGPGPGSRLAAAAGIDAVTEAVGRCRRGGRAVTGQEAAWLTVMLRSLRVRDDAWARMDPSHRDAHLGLWTDLTRRARPGYVAAPASLLAFVAWQSGDGALANVALDRALADDPQYSMAVLLRQVINSGAPPSLARLPMTPDQVAASYDDQEDGPGEVRAGALDTEEPADRDHQLGEGASCAADPGGREAR